MKTDHKTTTIIELNVNTHSHKQVHIFDHYVSSTQVDGRLWQTGGGDGGL